ncbi:unannotated protein [freshwater metagenome]|uniref:Unannotated protein n=1 Tax=freshwater metagenome TaxID=449393 RepID=A0A6J7FXK8_9ZZZZ
MVRDHPKRDIRLVVLAVLGSGEFSSPIQNALSGVDFVDVVDALQ